MTDAVMDSVSASGLRAWSDHW